MLWEGQNGLENVIPTQGAKEAVNANFLIRSYLAVTLTEFVPV